MAFSGRQALRLADFPVEIVLEIFSQLDVASVYSLSMVNRQFQALFQRNKAMILVPVLMRDFGPFDELLQVHTASVADLDTTSERYQPRTVILRRFPGDRGISFTPHSKTSSPAEEMMMLKMRKKQEEHERWEGEEMDEDNEEEEEDDDDDDDYFMQEVQGRARPHASASAPQPVVLTNNDLRAILERCQTVQWWEEIFPQMRWNYQPGDCRSLRPHERYRARRALYRFWLYGIYFHGDTPRPHVGLPAPFVRDVRTSFMRYFSSNELMELMDFVEIIKDLILFYICPRLDPGHFKVDIDVPLIQRSSRMKSMYGGFVDQSCWSRIIKTYAKLGPEEMRHYFENICSFHRERLVGDVNARHTNFAHDQESIQCAIRCVLDERDWLARPPSFPDDSVGGIVDFDDERDEERALRGGDASSTGLPASGVKRLGISHSMYSPRGDDGHNLEGNFLYQAEMEERLERAWLASRARKGASSA